MTTDQKIQEIREGGVAHRVDTGDAVYYLTPKPNSRGFYLRKSGQRTAPVTVTMADARYILNKYERK